MALINKLEAIGDAIREKTNTTEKMTLEQMASAISGITGGEGSLSDYIPEEAFNITGSLQYRFAQNSWNWFVERYGDRVTTTDIISGSSAFINSSELNNIPFTINFKSTYVVNLDSMFANCNKIKNIPKVINAKPNTMSQLFYGCYNIREIPDDIDATWDWSQIDGATSGYAGDRKTVFDSCYSLRKFPMSFLNHGNPIVNPNYSIYNSAFNKCTALDEIINLPFPHKNATWTVNAFGSAFLHCYRLKDMTFALQEDETPYLVNWKAQTIDMSNYFGYVSDIYLNRLLDYNSGITADKEVTDADTYQALKDDPDWFTCDMAYSRYNHDSAVNTINSLPDASAYLATAGGTNTIKFLGSAGSATDGGAINTLTEEEIAVAAAKGWTVTFV